MVPVARREREMVAPTVLSDMATLRQLCTQLLLADVAAWHKKRRIWGETTPLSSAQTSPLSPQLIVLFYSCGRHEAGKGSDH